MEIFDKFCWEDHKKVFTHDHHKIPGLRNIAYWNLSKANNPTPLHHHSNIVEIHCLIKGKRICNVNTKTYKVTGNELFLTFPNEPHNNGSYDLSPCSFYAFQIDLNDRKNLLGLNGEYSLAVYEILTNPGHRHLRFTPADQQLLKQAFDNISDGSSGALHLGVQYLTCFLFKIPDFFPVSKEERKRVDSNIKKVLNYIGENYIENVHLHELADLSGYSLSRFKIKFKEEVGMTPANYITFKKLEYAKHLLKTTDYSVTQIAMDSGFSSSNYFCTVLRKLSNHSPREYRQLCRENMPNES